MKTSNTKITRSPKTFLATFFWALMIIAGFLFTVVIRVYAQTPFDFSLSASGPHNVVQGRDLYIKVSAKTLSGTRGNTYLSVQNPPAGTSRFWPDIFTS